MNTISSDSELPFVLLVDDSEDDTALLVKALNRAEVQCRTYAVESGEAAIDYLSGKGIYQDRSSWPLPYLILLDLKMEGLSGFDVLRWIKNSETLKRIPVIVLSSSKQQSDMREAHTLGASSYLVKPTSFPELVELARHVRSYWLIQHCLASLQNA